MSEQQKIEGQFRHGDLLIERIDNLPENVKELKHRILAEGEATGHLHQFTELHGKLFESIVLDTNEEEKKMFIEVSDGIPDLTDEEWENLIKKDDMIVRNGIALKHPEHGTIPIPPGIYQVEHQQEYTPEEIKRVTD